LPFTGLRLSRTRPRAIPRGYAREPSTLGVRIRRRRLDLGLSQRILADRLGVRAEAVASWELGRYQPSIRLWPRIVELLDCDPLVVGAELADRICALRRRIGLTRKELAARTGLDEGTVADLEAGRSNPSARVIAIVRSILNRN
jgi:transcriptional regulator with XRE-family HTH domain